MTREEQIAIASCAYGSRGSSIDFSVGVKWADSNPKSPWVSVEDDLPCNHEELICEAEVSEGTETVDVFAINKYGDIWCDYMIYEKGKWRWNDFEPDYWMIAPKLPKE